MQAAPERRIEALAERCVVAGPVSTAELDEHREAAYTFSWLCVDARVLPIVEGAGEILALRVIARNVLNRAGGA